MPSTEILYGSDYRIEKPDTYFQPGELIDVSGNTRQISMEMSMNPDGSLRLQSHLPEKTRLISLKTVFKNTFSNTSDALWARCFGADMCATVAFSPLDKIHQIREPRHDHEWIASDGKKLPGGVSFLAGIVTEPRNHHISVVGYLPDPENDTVVTFQPVNGNIEATLWFDKTGKQDICANFAVLKGKDESVLKQYGHLLRQHLRQPEYLMNHPREVHQFLWPSDAKDFDAAKCERNLLIAHAIRNNPLIDGTRVIDRQTLDDGWITVQGDTDCSRFLNNSRFRSIREYVEWAEEKMGVDIELWLSVLESAEGAQTVKTLPHLFVQKDGKPYRIPHYTRPMLYGVKSPIDCIPDNICPFDISRKEVLEFLADRVRQIVIDTHATRFKLDFWHVTQNQIFMDGTDGKTRIALARNAMQYITDGIKSGARQIGREDKVQILFGQVPLYAVLGLKDVNYAVRTTDDRLPVPIWRTPIPNWTGINHLLEKLHHQIVNPLKWWNEADKQELRNLILKEVFPVYADGLILELNRYGIDPDLSRWLVLNKLAPDPSIRSLCIGNNLEELKGESLLRFAQICKSFKDGSWRELQEKFNLERKQKSQYYATVYQYPLTPKYEESPSN